MDNTTMKSVEHGGIVNYWDTVTTLLVSMLAFLLIVKLGVKNCKNYGNCNHGQKQNYRIPEVSLMELLKTLKMHKYAALPTCGYLFEKYNGAFKFSLGFYKFLVTCRLSIIQKLYLSANAGHLHKPSEFEKISTKSMQGNLFTHKADVWKVHRSVLARAFTHNSLQEQVKIFEEYSKKLVFTIDESLELQKVCKSTPICSKDISHAIASHVLFIILHIGTGKSIVGNQVESARFCSHINKLKQISSYRGKRPWLWFEITWFFHPKRWEIERTRIEMEAMFANALKRARKEMSVVGASDEDLVGKSLVELMVKGDFSDEKIFKELIMFIIVSNEAIPMVLKQLLFHLALNLEVQEKCRLEIGQMFEKLHSNNNAEMSIEILNDLQYLEQCIKETIRMYPALIGPARYLESPLVLDEYETIPQGSRVYMSAYHFHRDTKNYPEPEKFDPERFSPENIKKREKCEYMGFSEGPRNCIGHKSATLELKVLASYILYNFEAYTNNTIENFEADLGPARWPVADPKVELRRLQ